MPDELDRRLIERRRCLIARCYDKNHPNYNVYGARGIYVADEFRDSVLAWCDYMRSLPGASVHLTIDRIDPDGGYVRGNLRWADRKTQARNFRHATKFAGMSARDFAEKFVPDVGSEYAAKMLSREDSAAHLLTRKYRGHRRTDIVVCWGGEYMPLRQFAIRIGAKYPTVREKIKKGDSPETIYEWLKNRVSR